MRWYRVVARLGALFTRSCTAVYIQICIFTDPYTSPIAIGSSFAIHNPSSSTPPESISRKDRK